MFSKSFVVFSVFIASVYSHGVLVAVTGENGVVGQGFGVDPSTPRDGSRRNPFQQDSSIIRQNEIENGDSGACGRTLVGGVNDVPTMLEEASSLGLPSFAADGSVNMTLHQVNGDGAGPYTCGVSADGTGANFAQMKVTTNVPGTNSNSRARATPFALVAQMPQGTTCSGGPNGDACLVRCMNAARAGPFGGCVAVTNPGTAAAAPAAAPPATAAPAPAAPAAGKPAASAAATATKQQKRFIKTRVVGQKRAGQWM